jgi:hypothetical protein
MRAKNAEDWDELLTKYVESQKKVMEMEPACVSHQAARQYQIEYVKMGEKRNWLATEEQELRAAQAELLRKSDSHAKTQDFLVMSARKGLSRRQRREHTSASTKVGSRIIFGGIYLCEFSPFSLSCRHCSPFLSCR